MMLMGLTVAQLAYLLAWGEAIGIATRYMQDFEKVALLRFRWESRCLKEVPTGGGGIEVCAKHRRFAQAIIVDAAARIGMRL